MAVPNQGGKIFVMKPGSLNAIYSFWCLINLSFASPLSSSKQQVEPVISILHWFEDGSTYLTFKQDISRVTLTFCNKVSSLRTKHVWV